MAPVSADGGVSWLPAWQAAQQPLPADDALALLIPVRVNGYALIAGYVGLFSVLFFGGPICLVAGAFFAAPKAPWAVRLVALVVALLLGPLPPAACAYLAHRQLRANPAERGMARVVTGYVSAGLMVVVFVATVVLTLTLD